MRNELTLVGQLAYLTQVLLKYLNRAKLFLFVLDDGLGRYHLLWYTRRDEHEVLLGNLYATLFGVELANSHAFAHLPQLKLFRLIACKVDDIQPGYSGSVLAMALEHSWRAIEQPFEAFDEDRTQRSSAKITGHALMAVQHALVVAEQRQDVWKGVIVGNQWQVLIELACEVVDLQVVVRLGGFG